MIYQEFLDAMVDGVRKIAGKEAEVIIHQVTKNNGVVLDGLVIMERNRKFSPTIYLNGYYSQYLGGKEIDDIAQKVYAIYLANCNNITLPEDFFTDFVKIKSQIAFKLINYERNRQLLEKIPHRRWKDLAIVYFVVYDNLDKERAVITIYNNHIEFWGVTEEEINRLAFENTPKLYAPEIRPMNQVVSDMILKEGDEEDDIESLISHVNRMNEQFPMYVMTNKMRSCGAACMLYDGLLESFTNHIESDVYIIPSSIHEVILVPVDRDVTMEGLVDMVQTVNRNELSREEILSDTVYLFSRKNGFA